MKTIKSGLFTKQNGFIECKKANIKYNITHKKAQKTYTVYEHKNLTIEELRQGYRIITGLNNDNELTDNEIYNYMLDALKE